MKPPAPRALWRWAATVLAALCVAALVWSAQSRKTLLGRCRPLSLEVGLDDGALLIGWGNDDRTLEELLRPSSNWQRGYTSYRRTWGDSLRYVKSALPSLCATRSSVAVRLPLWTIITPTTLLALYLWWIKRRRFGAGQCGRCGYDMTGNISGVCPECGVPYEATMPVTGSLRSWVADKAWRRGLVSSVVLCYLLLLCAAAAWGFGYRQRETSQAAAAKSNLLGERARREMSRIGRLIVAYYHANGRMPDPSGWRDALCDSSWRERVPYQIPDADDDVPYIDPWGRPYQVSISSAAAAAGGEPVWDVVIESLGPEGRRGGRMMRISIPGQRN